MITVHAIDTPGLGDRSYLAHDGEATGTCAMGNLLARMPWNRDNSYDVDAVLDALSDGR